MNEVTIEIQFIFPGEGMCIDGGIVTPDSEITGELPEWYLRPSTMEDK